MPAAYPSGTAGAMALGSTAAGRGARAGSASARCCCGASACAGARRPAASPPPPGSSSTCVAALVWVANPYAAALLAPAAHLWLLAGRAGVAPARRPRRRRGHRRPAAARARRRPLRSCAGTRPARARLARRAGHRRRARLAARRGGHRPVARVLRRAGHGAARARPRGGHAPSPSRCARAGPPATPGRARSAARSRRCGDETRAAHPLDAADRRRRVPARRRGGDAAVAGAAVGAVRGPRAGEPAGPPGRDSSARRWPPWTSARCAACGIRAGGSRSPPARCAATRSPATRSGGSRCPRSAPRTSSSRAPGPSDLRKGPGHYPATPLPGERGTVGIAGHRTTYGAPFRRLNGVKRGDRIDADDAVWTLRLPRRAHAHRPAVGHMGDRSGRLRPADPVRLPPAVLGRTTDRRVRAPGALDAARGGR